MKLKINKPNLRKIRLIRLLRFLPTLTLLLLLTFFGLTIAFLYQYFYQTVAQVKVVSILRNQVALNQVNIPLYQKVLNAWEIKKQFDESKLSGLTDPFRPLSAVRNTEDQPTLEEANSPQP